MNISYTALPEKLPYHRIPLGKWTLYFIAWSIVLGATSYVGYVINIEPLENIPVTIWLYSTLLILPTILIGTIVVTYRQAMIFSRSQTPHLAQFSQDNGWTFDEPAPQYTYDNSDALPHMRRSETHRGNPSTALWKIYAHINEIPIQIACVRYYGTRLNHNVHHLTVLRIPRSSTLTLEESRGVYVGEDGEYLYVAANFNALSRDDFSALFNTIKHK